MRAGDCERLGQSPGTGGEEPGIPDPNSKASRLGIYNLDPAVRFWATKYKTASGEAPNIFSAYGYIIIDRLISALQRTGSRLREMRSEWERPPHKAVAQQSMAAGAVELF